MQEKHSGSKDTDITSGLVVAFVFLLAVLIAKTAGDFSLTKTSTSTKAAPKASAALYLNYCKGKVASNLGDRYNVDSVKNTVFAKLYATDCGNLNTRFAAGVLFSGGANDPAEPGICCVASGPLYVLNDTYCTNQMPSGHWSDGKTVAHIPALCKDKADCTGSYGTISTDKYTTTTSYKCDNVTKTSVSKNSNYCCMMPLPTNTP